MSTLPPLAREIAILVAFKLVILTVLYVVFFGPAARPQLDAGKVGTALFSTLPPKDETAR